MMHEVFSRLHLEKEQIISAPGVVLTHLEKGEILERYKSDPEMYKQIKSEVEALMQYYDALIAELSEFEKSQHELAHYDFKEENIMAGFVLDFGTAKKGFLHDVMLDHSVLLHNYFLSKGISGRRAVLVDEYSWTSCNAHRA